MQTPVTPRSFPIDEDAKQVERPSTVVGRDRTNANMPDESAGVRGFVGATNLSETDLTGHTEPGRSVFGGAAKMVLMDVTRARRVAQIDYRGLKLAQIDKMTTREVFDHLQIDSGFLTNHPLFDLDASHSSNCEKLTQWVDDNKPPSGKMTEHIGDPRANPTGEGLFFPFSVAADLRPRSQSLCVNDQRPSWYEDERCLTCFKTRPCYPGPLERGKCVTCQEYGSTHPKTYDCYWANPLFFITKKVVAKVYEGGVYNNRQPKKK